MELYINNNGKFVVLNISQVESIMEGICPTCDEEMTIRDYELVAFPELPIFYCAECDEDHCEAFHLMPLNEYVKMFNRGGA